MAELALALSPLPLAVQVQVQLPVQMQALVLMSATGLGLVRATVLGLVLMRGVEPVPGVAALGQLKAWKQQVLRRGLALQVSRRATVARARRCCCSLRAGAKGYQPVLLGLAQSSLSALRRPPAGSGWSSPELG